MISIRRLDLWTEHQPRLQRRLWAYILVGLFLVSVYVIISGIQSDGTEFGLIPEEIASGFSRRRLVVPHHHKTLVKDVRQEIAARRDLVSQGCANGLGWTENITIKGSFMNRRYNFSICRVPKIASTFWIRFLYQMANTDPMESPFDVNASLAYAHLSDFRIYKNGVPNYRKMATRVMFVREPFSRLFSAYVDKLMSPNPVFWNAWGSSAILSFRPGAQQSKENGTLQCADDTSFSEFVSFVVTKGYQTDNHLIPIHTMCSPCKNNYTVIGKMETFERDAKFAISLLGIPERQIRFDKMNADRFMDAVADSTGGAFSSRWLGWTMRCISREDAARRVWRKLQVRGFISWRQKLRLTEKQKKNLSMEEVRDMLLKSESLSTNATELKLQKKQALVEAFRSLNDKQLEDITKIYGNDFKLFAYSTSFMHDLMKDTKHLKNTKALDWRVDWDMSGV